MTLIVIISLSTVVAVLLAGFAALSKAQGTCVEGYEDATGFHFGTDLAAGRPPETAAGIHSGSNQAA